MISKEEAARLNLICWPDPVLTKKCEPVPEGMDVRHLVERMKAVMFAAGGVGLAAPQIGILLRVFVVSPIVMQDGVFINPEVTTLGRKEYMAEGCLSLPGLRANVARYDRVRVTSERRGAEVLTGWQAQVVQHEADHLDGKIRLSQYWR